MILLGLDPGTTVTGAVIYNCSEARVVYAANKLDNELVREALFSDHWLESFGVNFYIIESMSPRGATLGHDTMTAIRWIGRFEELCCQSLGEHRVELMPRDTIKRVLLGRTNLPKADSLIRQLLLDEVGPKGTKKAPGPTFGVSGHAWQALAAVWAHLYMVREGVNAP